MTEDEEIEALYGAPLASFIEVRKAAAARLKASGDKDAASRVLAIAKPTPAAWAVNQLWRTHADAFAALFETGDELRAALREAFAGRGQAGAPVALQKQQRDAVTSLTAVAESQLTAGGIGAGSTVLDRVGTTLRTISTTGAWGDAPAGRLPRELGEADLASIATLLVDEGAPRAVRPKPTAAPTGQPAHPHAQKKAQPSSHERITRGSHPAPAKDKEGAKAAGSARHDGKHDARPGTKADATKRDAETKAEAAKRAKELERARAEVEAATEEERSAREAAKEAQRAADHAATERDAAQKRLEAARRRADGLHRDAEEAARAAKEAMLEVKQGADALVALERAEVAAGRALRSAGIVVDQAEQRLAAARTARDDVSRG